MQISRWITGAITAVVLTAGLLAVPAQRAPSKNTKRSQLDKWREPARERSKIDDSEIIILKLQAENVIYGWLASARPELLIRYKEGAFDVYIITGMAVDPELGRDDFTVRIRLDKQEAYTEHWQESTDHSSLFSPDPVDLVRKMATAKTMVFEFTPFNASPQVITFDVLGLARHMDDNFDDWRAKRK